MSDQSKLGLGKIITEPQSRDAIHIAVAPVVAAQILRPGEHVGLFEDGKAALDAKPIGIVDPFLKGRVLTGQTFWLYLYPGSITSLRHEWTHPAFKVEEVTLQIASRRWIENWCARIPLAYEAVMEGAADYVRDREAGGYGEFLCFGGLLEGEYVPDEFWTHYQIVTGKKVHEDHQGTFFTCSC